MLDPSPVDVEMEDIAHGLARVARWNGQTTGKYPFSVAQHSMLVQNVCCVIEPKSTPQLRLYALLHDAPEYVIGDMITPFKNTIGGEYKNVEQRLQEAIFLSVGLPARMSAKDKSVIKKADKTVAYFEAVTLAGFSKTEAQKFFGVPAKLKNGDLDLNPMPTTTAQKKFLGCINKTKREVR